MPQATLLLLCFNIPIPRESLHSLNSYLNFQSLLARQDKTIAQLANKAIKVDNFIALFTTSWQLQKMFVCKDSHNHNHNHNTLDATCILS